LEGVEINRQEKRDAELDYTKAYSEKWRKEGNSAEFIAEHPRYAAFSESMFTFTACKLLRVHPMQCKVVHFYVRKSPSQSVQ